MEKTLEEKQLFGTRKRGGGMRVRTPSESVFDKRDGRRKGKERWS